MWARKFILEFRFQIEFDNTIKSKILSFDKDIKKYESENYLKEIATYNLRLNLTYNFLYLQLVLVR